MKEIETRGKQLGTGTALIGGLIMNMLITRLLIPVGYLVVRGRSATTPS